MVVLLNKMISNFIKLEKFDGDNFIRWQKVQFLLNFEGCVCVEYSEASG